jgi:hypothetical protein
MSVRTIGVLQKRRRIFRRQLRQRERASGEARHFSLNLSIDGVVPPDDRFANRAAGR